MPSPEPLTSRLPRQDRVTCPVSRSMRRLATLTALVVPLRWAGPALAQDGGTPPPPESGAETTVGAGDAETRARLQRLEAALEASEQRAAEREAALAGRIAELEQAKAPEPKPAPSDAPVVKVDVGGYVQAEAVLLNETSEDQVQPTTGEPLNETRFLIRRARLRMKGERGFFSGSFEIDGNTVRGPQVRIVSAALSARTPAFGGTLGLFKVPFGFEVQQSTPERLFLEPSNVIRAFFPGEYDLGLQLQGKWRLVRAQLAVMNGAPLSDRRFPGRDPNENKDLLGRLGVETRVFDRVLLQAGVSGLRGKGFHAGSLATKESVGWKDANGNGQVEPTELQAVPATAATPSSSFERYAVGSDLRLTLDSPRFGKVWAYTELIWAKNLDRGTQVADPIASGRNLRERSVAVGGTWELPMGAVAGVRWDRYDPGVEATDASGAPLPGEPAALSTTALALGWRYRPVALFLLEYDRNTNTAGRTAAGLPTTLPSDALTFRVQGEF